MLKDKSECSIMWDLQNIPLCYSKKGKIDIEKGRH